MAIPRGTRKQRPVVTAVDPNSLTAWSRRFTASLATRGFSEATVRNRELALARFIDWCSTRSISRPEEVTKPILERYRAHLFHYRNPSTGKPLGYATQALFLVGVKLYFKWLTKQNVLLWNPGSELELPKYPRRIPRQVLTVEEVEHVLAQPDVREPLGLRDRCILEVLYSTGMRRAELAGLTIFDWNQKRSTLHIRQAKGGRPRLVPVGERTGLWLKRYIDEARHQLAIEPDDGTLFLNNTGEPFLLKRLSALVKQHVKNADVGKSGSCHLLRHTAASQMIQFGADIRWVQQLLGHADLNTTAIYTQTNIEHLAKIHRMTHPGAAVHFEPPSKPVVEGLRVAVSGEPFLDLQAALEAEEEDEAAEA